MGVLGFRGIAAPSRSFLVLIVGAVVLAVGTPHAEGRARLDQRFLTLRPSCKKVRLDLVVSKGESPSRFVLQMFLYQRRDQKYERVDMTTITTNYRHSSELVRFDVKQSTAPDQGQATVKYKIADNDTPRGPRLYFSFNSFNKAPNR